MICGNSKLSYDLYRSARTDISPGISIANNIGPLLGYISLSTSNISGLIYVDCMINDNNKWTVL